MTRRKLDYYGSKTLRGDDEIIVAAFDTETDGLGGELLSVQWGIFGEVRVDTSPDKLRNFFEEIMQYPLPVVWFGHFAQYDWRYMMDYIAENKLPVEVSMRTDNDVYQITIKGPNGKVVMRDSYALWNSKLEKLATSFCPELPKLELDFETTKFDINNPDHIAYAKRDVMILLVGLPRFFSMLNKHFDINPNGTFASTSLKGWQKSLPADVKYNTSKLDAEELFIRQSYYGGLVFLTDTRKHNDCETFDLNSSYPASMCEYGVPFGRAISTRDYCVDNMGIYHVRISAPHDLKIPVIPARDQKGGMRWYRGAFDTVCTNRELIFATKQGYTLENIYSGIVFEETIYPFNDYIEMCKRIRKEYKGGPEEYLAKFMQNSLYGKFGSRRERLRVMSVHSMDEDDFLGATPYDDSGRWYIKKEIDSEMRCNPSWAVFITAHSRLRLLQAAYSIGVENVLYGDTDSLTVKAGTAKGIIETGDDYGQWKLEKEWSVFRAVAPKVYSGILKDGKMVGAAKGLPRKNLTDRHWRELLEDGATSAQAYSLASLRVTLKSGVKPAEILMRHSSDLRNSSNFELLPNGAVNLKMAA